MKKTTKNIFILAGAAILFHSCELTEVTNPYVTEDRFLSGFQTIETWMNGVRRQASVTVGRIVEFTEIASDNYFNNYTQSSKVFDTPEINYFDQDVTNTQAEIHKLLEMSTYGLNKIIPTQEGDMTLYQAECFFYQAYAYILAAENYVGLPIEKVGEVKSPAQLFEAAITTLTEAHDLFSEVSDKEACLILISRCYYGLGDIDASIRYATQAISNPLAIKQAQYGTEKGPTNNFQNAIFSNSTNWFAPLPRLDFLDPKYFHQTTPAYHDEKPIAIAKAEEAYLILAEAQVAQHDVQRAKETLLSLLKDCVDKRPQIMLDDSKDTRNGGNRKDYATTSVLVKFDATSPAISGLVLDRSKGKIPAYTISGTHITEADIQTITSEDEALYLIYLLRQEIFIAEGRRMSDLGIRFPISQREQLSNPHVNDTHIQAIIPDFIPVNRGMDDFTYDIEEGVVTMTHDMNRILVANKNSPYIMPFHH